MDQSPQAEPRLPKYHETFIPRLSFLKDGVVLHYKLIRSGVRKSHYAHLPKELYEQKVSTGENTLENRIGWGNSYLKLSGYLECVKSGNYRITPKGLKALERGQLDIKEVKSQAEFIAHQKAQAEKKGHQSKQLSDSGITEHDENSDDMTPEEKIDQGINAIAKGVKQEILEQMKEMDPYDFETLVNDLLVAMGYGTVEGTNKSNDGGIDGVVNQDKLGLEKIYVQAKRFNEGKVRETSIRDFIGAMSGDTHKGIFVTTSDFDPRAIQKAKDAHHKIILINGDQLCELMYSHGVGVQDKKSLIIKTIDEDYWQ